MSREQAIHALVALDKRPAALRDWVSEFAWDWDGPPLATLRREHVLTVLERWQSGGLTPAEVEEWANLIEGRNDIDFDPADPAVADAVFTLSNPVLQGSLAEVGVVLSGRLRS